MTMSSLFTMESGEGVTDSNVCCCCCCCSCCLVKRLTIVGALFVSEMTSLNISLSLPLFSLLFLAALVGSSHGGASLACRFVATVTVAFEFAVDAIDAVVPALAKRIRPFLEHGLLSIGAATTTMVDFARVVARFEVS